jgi:hypothetical protein
MTLRQKLNKAMLEAGYVVYTIRPDTINPFASIIEVKQDIKRGQRPSFWTIVDTLGLDGKFGTQFSHQIKTKEIPDGTYLTFV